MKIRSILNKLLLLAPAALVAPLLTMATPLTPPFCTQTLGGSSILTGTNPVSFADHDSNLTSTPPQIYDATFTCTGVTFTPPNGGVPADDAVQFDASGTGFTIFSDISTLFGPDTDVVFSGTDSTTHQIIGFLVTEGTAPGMETVSMTPEPGSMLLFGTGLLIAGGFVRRRLLAPTLA